MSALLKNRDDQHDNTYQLCEAFWQELAERLGEPERYGLYRHAFFINGDCSMAQGTKLARSGKDEKSMALNSSENN